MILLFIPKGGVSWTPLPWGARVKGGYSLLEENTPFVSPREGRGESPSTPDIVSL